MPDPCESRKLDQMVCPSSGWISSNSTDLRSAFACSVRKWTVTPWKDRRVSRSGGGQSTTQNRPIPNTAVGVSIL